MTAPRVAVVMPAYNAARHIETAIRSVLAQSLDDFEFVVVDDASTDATPEIAARLAAADPRLRVHRMPENGGNAVARNTGIGLTRAALIAMQDADDIAHPDRLARQVAAIEADPGCLLVAASVHWIDPEGRIFGTQITDYDTAMLRWVLCFKMRLIQSTFLFRRTLPDGSPALYDASMRQTQDYDLLARLIQAGGVRCLPDVLAGYRMHPDQVSSVERSPQSRRALEIGAALRRALLPADVAAALDPVADAVLQGGVPAEAFLEGLDRHTRHMAAEIPSHRGAFATLAALEAHFLLTRLHRSQARAMADLARRRPAWALRAGAAKIATLPAKRRALRDWAHVPGIAGPETA